MTVTVLLSHAATTLLTTGVRGRIGVVRTLLSQLKEKAPAEFQEFLELLTATGLSCVFGGSGEDGGVGAAGAGDCGQQLEAALTQLFHERWMRLVSAALVGGYGIHWALALRRGIRSAFAICGRAVLSESVSLSPASPSLTFSLSLSICIYRSLYLYICSLPLPTASLSHSLTLSFSPDTRLALVRHGLRRPVS